MATKKGRINKKGRILAVVVVKFTEKHNKNHETDNETHPNTPNIFPYVPKCFELT